MQNAIHQVTITAKSIGFRFSTEKTVAMLFSRRRNPEKAPKILFEGKNLKFVDEHRILGMVFDKKLNWGSHIKDLKVRANKRMNILRMLCNPRYGAKRQHLLTLHQSIILSVLDYGSIIYDSASESKLKSLDSTNMKGIRIATGVFKTSPNESVLVEAGMLPLSLRREMQTMNYAISVLSFREHSNFNDLSSCVGDEDLMLRDLKKNETPFYERAIKVLSKHKLDPENLEKNRTHKFPPWKTSNFSVNLSLTSHLKAETCPQKFKLISLDTINKHSNHEILYTDGSKTQNAVGWGYSSYLETRNGRLNKHTSVQSAELVAIYMALKASRKSKFENVLICSDSLSSLMSIQNIYSKNSLVQKIQEQISKSNKTFTLLWIPGHVGIIGNEEADVLAKKGSKKAPSFDSKIYPGDLKTSAKRKIWEKWGKKVEGNRVFKLKGTAEKCSNIKGLSRKDSIIIARLRIGHTRLTHKHLFDKNVQSPKCNCGAALTVDHMLSCSREEILRKTLGLNHENILREADCSKMMKITTYLKKLGKYFEI